MGRYETQEERSNGQAYVPYKETVEVDSYAAAADYRRLQTLLKNIIAREREIDADIRRAGTWSSKWWGRVKEADRLRGQRLDAEQKLQVIAMPSTWRR